MITLSFANGDFMRVLNASSDDGRYGFHPQFGFVSHDSEQVRLRARKVRGLSTTGSWLAEFKKEGAEWIAVSGCRIESSGEKTWSLITDFGQFILREVEGFLSDDKGFSHRIISTEISERNDLKKYFLAALGSLVILVFLLPKEAAVIEVPKILEPIEVTMQPEIQRSVNLADSAAIPEKVIQNADAKARVAVEQNLGFLALSGRKDLTKALGGLQTVPGASAGAGAGGHEGSGGELLVGLGQGVQRTTVGNSGVAGLGGIGTKGSGGGAGGYGNSLLASGNGRALSSIPLSEDMVLDGGLDRSVIQATIAKYLNQIRACYEQGLQKSPGLLGQVTMAFMIAGSGAVTSANVATSSLGNAGVEQCMSQKMLTWIFPSPRGGISVKVQYPFLLRPVKS